MIMILNKTALCLAAMLALLFSLALLSSCSQGGFPGTEEGRGEFILSCAIPDNAALTRGPVEATPDESRLRSVTVLFFADDAQSNGLYVGRTSLSLSSLADNYSKLPVSLPAGTNLETTYRLLVVGNVDVPQDASLRGKKQGEVRNALKYTFPQGYSSPDFLPVSGETIKQGGTGNVEVTLVRAVCRIDLKLKEGENMIFHSAALWNVLPNVYLFSGRDDRLERITSATQTTLSDACGFYAGENYEPYNIQKYGFCLIVSITDTDLDYGAFPSSAWYRIDVGVDADGVQQLLRNHVYTVTVHNLIGPGYSTPEAAYKSEEEKIQIDFTADISDWIHVELPPHVLD